MQGQTSHFPRSSSAPKQLAKACVVTLGGWSIDVGAPGYLRGSAVFGGVLLVRAANACSL